MSDSAAVPKSSPGTLWQNMPVIALENSVFDGRSTVSEIRKHGDHGVGTWDQLNGEGLIVDGEFFQVRSDGSVHQQPDTAIMPWVSINFFRPDTVFELPSKLEYSELEAFIDPYLPTVNTYYALRVEGCFETVTTRTLPKQAEPYPPLEVIERTQPEFSFTDVEGVMVGYRSPPYATNFSPPGFHLHFLKQDRTGGGHALDFSVDQARISIQRLSRLEQEIPDYPEFEHANLSQAET